MKIRDIVPLRSAVTDITFEETESGEWEIHFSLTHTGGRLSITKHLPMHESRTWKSLDNALVAAHDAFGPYQTDFSIKCRKRT